LRGWKILAGGGSSLDAVEAAVVALEDNPLFNAGRGSALTLLGHVEMDAAVMCSDSRAGAVAAVSCIKNPVRLARQVMEYERHVLLAGEGARAFARSNGIEECTEEYLITQRQRERWQRSQGTVGCVAMDDNGLISAATSTGGMSGQLDGRVGDSPLPGCGTYANPCGAVSCTGVGEAIIKVLMAKAAVDFLAAGLAPGRAAQAGVDLLAERTGSEAGLIMIDAVGTIAHAHNTQEMPVCFIARDARPVTAA
jgi:beta-aspartyl-peptidase (threonine type)